MYARHTLFFSSSVPASLALPVQLYLPLAFRRARSTNSIVENLAGREFDCAHADSIRRRPRAADHNGRSESSPDDNGDSTAFE